MSLHRWALNYFKMWNFGKIEGFCQTSENWGFAHENLKLTWTWTWSSWRSRSRTRKARRTKANTRSSVTCETKVLRKARLLDLRMLPNPTSIHNFRSSVIENRTLLTYFIKEISVPFNCCTWHCHEAGSDNLIGTIWRPLRYFSAWLLNISASSSCIPQNSASKLRLSFTCLQTIFSSSSPGQNWQMSVMTEGSNRIPYFILTSRDETAENRALSG